MDGLLKAGFRFTYRPSGGWNWRPEVLANDLDATDMTSEEFEQAVRIVETVNRIVVSHDPLNP